MRNRSTLHKVKKGLNMRVYRSWELKWYHLLIALGGLLAVGVVVVWIFMGDRRPTYFVEDETDLVE